MVLCKDGNRFVEADVSATFLFGVVAYSKGPPPSQAWAIPRMDRTPIEVWTSMKSFRHEDGYNDKDD
jgi:hypothetical protein